MIKIGVIADTHNVMPDEMPLLLKDAQEIWHLGDVCMPRTLDLLELLNVPVHIVRGNNDFHPWPLTLDLQREDVKFHLVHIPPRQPYIGNAHILLHGHTHVPRDEKIGSVRYLNPGTVSRPDRGAPPSYAMMTVDGNAVTWKVRRLG